MLPSKTLARVRFRSVLLKIILRWPFQIQNHFVFCTAILITTPSLKQIPFQSQSPLLLGTIGIGYRPELP